MISLYNSIKYIHRVCNKTPTFKTLNNLILCERIRLFGTETKAIAKLTFRQIRARDRKRYDAASVVLLVIPVSAFGLGVWQIFRKLEKDKINEKLIEKAQQPVVDFPQNLNELKDMEFCEVRVKGRFDHSKEIHMGPRPLIDDDDALSKSMSLLSRSKAGYLVITPFTLSDRNLTILVNRGWVPTKKKSPAARPEGQITDEVEFTGLVRSNEVRKPFGSKNDVSKGQWVYRDLNEMSRVTGAAPILIDAVKESTIPGGPVGGQTLVEFPNDHLSYLVTWFALSAVSGYMWYLRHIPKLKLPV